MFGLTPILPDAEAWWQAVRSREPQISYAYFLGMGAVPAYTSFCALACECRARNDVREGIHRALESLGYRGDTPKDIRRIRGSRGLRSHRELLALAEWAAILVRPAARGGCLSLDPPAWYATGLAAYALLYEELTWRTAIRGNERKRFLRLAAEWADLRARAALFLHELAGRKRTPFALRLRRSADLFQRESDEVWSRIPALKPLRPADLATRVQHAHYLADQAAGHLFDALNHGLALPRAVAEPLLGSSDKPLSGVALQEMIYLARAGTRPLRELAAGKLAGSDNPRAIAALTQLLYDSDGPTAETALWALTQAAPRRAHLFIDAYRNVPRVKDGLDYSLRRGLLFAIAEAGSDEVRRFLAEVARETEGEDTKALAHWAKRLLERES